LQPYEDRTCQHCGANFQQGQLFLDICNQCLNTGHIAGSRACPQSQCLRNRLTKEFIEEDSQWNLNIRGMTFDQIRKAAIRLVLTKNHGNVRAAARELAVAKATIYRNLEPWERRGRIIDGKGFVR